MKVYITSTPEVDPSLIINITELLNEIKGTMVFEAVESFDNNQLSIIDQRFNGTNIPTELSFEDFFKICLFQRTMTRVHENDYFILITSIHNNLNWFSAFKKRDIFVHSIDWDKFTGKDPKFGIAYQIIENIFQSLIKLDISDVINEPNIHMTSIGCINDMCNTKSEVILKLRTGYICQSCEKRALDLGVDEETLLHIQDAIQKIREKLTESTLLQRRFKPQKLMIDSELNISVKDKTLKLPALSKVLYIYFLNHLDGVLVDSMNNDTTKKEILELYWKINPLGEEESAYNLCLEHFDDNSTFLRHKSEMNKKIIEQIDDIISEYYVVNKIKSTDNNKNFQNIYKTKLSNEDIIKDV